MLHTEKELEKIFYKNKIIVKRHIKVSNNNNALLNQILQNFASEFPLHCFFILDRLKKKQK